MIIEDGNQVKTNIIVGGHSSSGRAAFEATRQQLFEFVPMAFFGLDPYQISPTTADDSSNFLSLPALYWGLRKTTCLVNVEKAAWAAYMLTSAKSGGKVLYAIDNDGNSITHCVFTDRGCGMGPFVVCPTRITFSWLYESVARSLHSFINALENSQEFTSDIFQLPETLSGKVLLYVNDGP